MVLTFLEIVLEITKQGRFFGVGLIFELLAIARVLYFKVKMGLG